MSTRFTVHFEGIGQLMADQGLRRTLRDSAERIAARARTVAGGEKTEIDVTVSEGSRPKGRPYARVAAARSDEHWSSRDRRTSILNRAVETSGS